MSTLVTYIFIVEKTIEILQCSLEYFLNFIEMSPQKSYIIFYKNSKYVYQGLTYCCNTRTVIHFHFSLSAAFSLQLSPFSPFLTPKFMQSSNPSCGRTLFLVPDLLKEEIPSREMEEICHVLTTSREGHPEINRHSCYSKELK